MDSIDAYLVARWGHAAAEIHVAKSDDPNENIVMGLQRKVYEKLGNEVELHHMEEQERYPRVRD